MGAFDQDINAKVSLANPQLYERGIKGLEYSRTVFWTYMFDGLYQSAVVFFIPFLVYRTGTSATGHGYSMEALVEMGTTVAAAAVVCVTLFVGLNTSYHTALMLGVLVLSSFLLYVSCALLFASVPSLCLLQLWVAIYSAFPFEFNYLVVILFGTFDFWALVCLIQVIALGPRFLYKYLQSNYWPIDNNIVREASVVKKLNRHIANVEDGLNGGYSEKKSGHRSQTPVPQLNVPISESPMMNRRTPSAMQAPTIDESQVEMAELSRNRGPTPISAVPMHSPSKQSRQRIPQEQYDEVGEEALASPTTTTFPPRDYLSARERQHSGTPLSPGLYTSPPLSPRSGRYGSDGDSPNMRREGSMASFATANSEPYSDGEGEQYQYAGYAR